MKVLAMVRAELARLTATAMSRIALLALLLVPVLYGGLYLWANQDPYAGLDRVPVALVVADTGARVDSTPHNYGKEVGQQLITDGRFQWNEVSAATAKAGVADATYDFSVTIPANFSESIASAAGTSPRQAAITLTTNDTNSYLASTIGSQAAMSIREAIIAKVSRAAADRFLVGFSDVRSGLVTAADGAGRVTDGAASASTGSAALADGAGRLAAGTSRLAAGLDQLATGTGSVADGAVRLADAGRQVSAGTSQVAAGTGQVSSGAGQVSDGAGQVAAGTSQVAAGTAQVADGAKKTAAGTSAIAAGARQAGTAFSSAVDSLTSARGAIQTRLVQDGLTQAQIDAVLASLDPVGSDLGAGNAILAQAGTQLGQLAVKSSELSDGASATAAGATRTATGAAQTAAGASQTAAGAARTATGAAQTAAGAAQTAAGATALADGANKARDGAAAAATGAAQSATGAAGLADGAVTLRDGLGVLKTGAGSLRDGLAGSVTVIPNSDAPTRTLQGSTIADPVALKTAAVTSAGSYGAGLAPFFASLAGWIGIYALFLIVKPVSRRAITALHSPLRITLAGWLTPGLLGLVQMAGLFAILAGLLKFQVQNPVGTYSMMGLAALAFAAIILALNVWLGSVGQFIGLVLMVIQLVTAGGTFPWQTLPGPLAWLHKVVPMSYAVDGIRQLMYGGNPATAWYDAGVLALWMIGGLLVAAIGVVRMTHFRTLRDLRPSLIG